LAHGGHGEHGGTKEKKGTTGGHGEHGGTKEKKGTTGGHGWTKNKRIGPWIYSDRQI